MAINDNLSSIVTDFEGKILKINDLYLQKTGYERAFRKKYKHFDVRLSRPSIL